MTPLQQDVRVYIRACEHLLSAHLPQLSSDEQELVVNYAREILQHFASRSGASPSSQQTKNPCHARGDHGQPNGRRTPGHEISG